MRTDAKTLMVLLAGALALTACEATDARSGRERVIVVPSTATTTPAYERDGNVSSKRYVVRMSDGKRDWEIEFPDTARGYRLNIPMGSKPSDAIDVQGDALTEADKRFIEANRRDNPGMEREGMYVDGKNAADPERPGPGSELPPVPGEDPKKGTSGADGVDPWSRGEDTPAPSRRSYYLGIEKVQQLYRARRYEVAIVYLTKLDEDYPNDVKIMSMMGTLLMKTNKLDAAREYWERVLAIDPNNRGVIEAMKQLNARQGFDAQPPAGDPSTNPILLDP